MKSTTLLLLCFLCNTYMLFGQLAESRPYLTVNRTAQPIELDGDLTEAVWQTSTPATEFWEYFPTDTVLADPQTEIYMAFDDQFLYIGAKCYSVGEDYVITSLRRDFRAGGNDNLTFLIDPFSDRTNAFVFGMNPLGVTREALLSNGGQNRDDWNSDWDNKWKGVSKIHSGYWTCELAIPFSTLRYKEGSQEWNFNSYRFDTQSNTRSTWNPIPQNQIIMSLAYMGVMKWEEPLKKPGANISVIPYLTAGYDQNFLEGTPANRNSNVGGDAKIGITPSLNLDLTVNPDFSQVEVDEQVINLERFEIFFPEKRQFFLENSDLFGRFGDESINPFFSRRIGVAVDTTTGVNIQNPIYYGARLSGKLDNNWRMGLLNMQTAKDEDNGLPSFNYTVAALQRKVFSRSNVGMIMVNKQALNQAADTGSLYNPYNRVFGLDYNLASSDNRWNGKTFLHKSFSPEGGDKTFAHGATLAYQERKYSLAWMHQYVGEDYNAEVGFVRRKDYWRVGQEAQLYFYPGNKINQHSIGLETSMFLKPGFGRSDHQLELYWDADLTNTSRLRVTLQNDYTYLFEDFDPTRSDATPLPGAKGYTYTRLRGFFFSDRRKKLSYSVEPSIGQFFNGYQYGMEGSITYRYQPIGLVTFNFNYNYIDLPKPYAQASIFLIGPRIDLTFTRSLFLTTFIQYNSQLKNVNINTRLQWRFAPVSDFYLVYTDNYASDSFNVRTRAIVAKVSYWLNI